MKKILFIADSNNTSDLLFHTLTSDDYGDEVKVEFPVSGSDNNEIIGKLHILWKFQNYIHHISHDEKSSML